LESLSFILAFIAFVIGGNYLGAFTRWLLVGKRRPFSEILNEYPKWNITIYASVAFIIIKLIDYWIG
jgi:hypothetical protein